MNTTDSAVRVTHLPTGIVVAMQDEKSQLQNRAKAMQVLRARLLKAEQDRQAAEQSHKRKTQVGAGGRSEKVRTYNFKENRVTDHRVKVTLHKLDRVLEGDLDEIVDALIADEHDRQLAGEDGAREREHRRRRNTCAPASSSSESPRGLGSATEARWLIEQALGSKTSAFEQAQKRHDRDAVGGGDRRGDGRAAARRRAAPVRARQLGVPEPRARGRPARADPPP